MVELLKWALNISCCGGGASDFINTSSSSVILMGFETVDLGLIGGGNGGVVGTGAGGGVTVPTTTSGVYNGSSVDVIEDEDDSDHDFFLFVTYGILLTLIGLMGVAGNALSIVVLSRPQMRSSINCCLIGLATFDIVLLVTSVLMFGVRHLCIYTQTFLFYNRFIYPYLVPSTLYPMGLIAQTGSVWVTVTVTVERFVAVCLPLHAKSLCTYGRARVYIVAISIFSVVYNLPRFWEVERGLVYYPSTNETVLEPEPSWLRQNPTYVNIYITWMYLFVLYFVPFVMLAVLNGVIWVKVRKANRERQQLSRLQKKEMGLAIMLFCVVVVFFICNILPLVVNILEMVGIIVDELTVSSNLLVTMNSSVNFVIYCIFGQKFRRILLRTMCSCCPAGLLRGGRFDRTAATDLEESVYPVSSAGFATETKSLLHYNNGNGTTGNHMNHVSTTTLNIGQNGGSGGGGGGGGGSFGGGQGSPSSSKSVVSLSILTVANKIKGVQKDKSLRRSSSRPSIA